MEEIKTVEPKETKWNGKTIKLTCKFCAKWGFTSQVNRFQSSLIQSLLNLGYKVIYKIIAVLGANGEYYVFVDDKNNKLQIIFSNNKYKHKNAIFGSEVDETNVDEIIKKIEELI